MKEKKKKEKKKEKRQQRLFREKKSKDTGMTGSFKVARIWHGEHQARQQGGGRQELCRRLTPHK
jgi:hypothetical protein